MHSLWRVIADLNLYKVSLAISPSNKFQFRVFFIEKLDKMCVAINMADAVYISAFADRIC